VVHFAYEPVSSLREGFYEQWLLPVVAQGLAQLLDGGVEAVIKVHKSVSRPKLFLELFASDDFARTFQEHDKRLKRQNLQLDFAARFVKLSRTQIHFEDIKPYDAGGAAWRRHGVRPAFDDYTTPKKYHDWGGTRH
jgi:hypothetical protein